MTITRDLRIQHEKVYNHTTITNKVNKDFIWF